MGCFRREGGGQVMFLALGADASYLDCLGKGLSGQAMGFDSTLLFRHQ